MDQSFFTLSDAAISALRSRKAANQDRIIMRVRVDGGGCSGFQYHFAFDAQKENEDQLLSYGDVEVVVDSISLGFLDQAVLDYESKLSGSRFFIKNPNTTAQCGCGKSFSV